ncbi:hypothetical protein D3C76_1565050 [compost metagenome]
MQALTDQQNIVFASHRYLAAYALLRKYLNQFHLLPHILLSAKFAQDEKDVLADVAQYKKGVSRVLNMKSAHFPSYLTDDVFVAIHQNVTAQNQLIPTHQPQLFWH